MCRRHIQIELDMLKAQSSTNIYERRVERTNPTQAN